MHGLQRAGIPGDREVTAHALWRDRPGPIRYTLGASPTLLSLQANLFRSLCIFFVVYSMPACLLASHTCLITQCVPASSPQRFLSILSHGPSFSADRLLGFYLVSEQQARRRRKHLLRVLAEAGTVGQHVEIDLLVLCR